MARTIRKSCIVKEPTKLLSAANKKSPPRLPAVHETYFIYLQIWSDNYD